ncbi:hypothetical protein ETH_00005035 [Eimeria tenella]|uniref:Uncharacterized protein n=1 Tax=Eimeria tenella TaxID=5802 RepID=U6KGE3_EIMTE|nr:hypothetical protein ETH_00005035 [Eimeria tenella]CDJ37014.1 hypothetical protein ETH_00005035 [Eimeria tenella]|eukprot:XP_013227852.1 hypothetical protein ETH_00005035 [Eimeria tenella]
MENIRPPCANSMDLERQQEGPEEQQQQQQKQQQQQQQQQPGNAAGESPAQLLPPPAPPPQLLLLQPVQQQLEQQQQQQQRSEGPWRPRPQQLTVQSLPMPCQGPLQGQGPLELVQGPHEVLPQPQGLEEGAPLVGGLLGPPAPSGFPLLQQLQQQQQQQLQEEAATLAEGIAPLPIVPLPTFVGVPLPVAVEAPRTPGGPPGGPPDSVSLTVLQHPPEGGPPPCDSPRGIANSLQRRGPQRGSKSKPNHSNLPTSPRLGGPPCLGVGVCAAPQQKLGARAANARQKRPLQLQQQQQQQQQHAAGAAAGGALKGSPRGALSTAGPSAASLHRSASVSNCLNRSSSSSSEGSGDNSSSSNLPTEADRNSNSRWRCSSSSSSSRLRRRRWPHREPCSSISLTMVLCCIRWFGLLLLSSAPLLLFLLLLPIDFVGWLQVPASLCLFGSHIPRLCFMIQAKSHECLPVPLVLMGVLCNGCWALLGYISGLSAVCCVGVAIFLVPFKCTSFGGQKAH